MIDKLLEISLSEVENGFSYSVSDETYTCLICGKKFETGEVFSFDGRFFEASKAVKLHIEKEHGKMFDILTSFDKKYTSITENQKELLTMFYEGLSDSEIAKRTSNAPATIRHQRFMFREKAKQAKLFLAIFEIVEGEVLNKKVSSNNDDIIDIHNGAKMVDDRYLITKEEEEKICSSVFESLKPLKLKIFSPKEKKKIVILRKVAAQFDKGIKYSESEVNSILKAIYEDYATIRRYLIEYGFMERTKDCKEYWLK
jgi:Uncharacterized protein conserved in bacteria